MSQYGRQIGIILFILVTALTISCSDKVSHPEKSIGIEQYPGTRDLYSFAEWYRKKHGLPALGVGIVRNGKIIGLGMAGMRRTGTSDWATLDDYFDVASCSKSVTATIAAMLVERGLAKWNMTIKETFPEMQSQILESYHNVTLDLLLRHRSGMDRWMSTNELWIKWNQGNAGSSATEKRRLFVEKVLQNQPRYAPGTDSYYCNDGYIVAGSMLERVTGKPWEELVHEMLFEPLSLNTMNLGIPTSDPTTIVWGHEEPSAGLRTGAVRPDPDEYGDPPFGSPSGFLYCTVVDLLRFVDFHIRGESGNGSLLSKNSFTLLHTPIAGQRFALGWEVELTRDGQGNIMEKSVFQGGYSGRFRSNMWFSPESRTGTVIVYNHGGANKVDAYADIFYALLNEIQLPQKE